MDSKNGIIAEYYINEEECLLCERYFYEFSGLLKLMTQFTSDSPYKVDRIRYAEILENYMEAYVTYNVFFNYLREKYVIHEEYKRLNSDYEYLIDFNNKSIYIQMKGSCNVCQK